jgi:tRNA threonylcarbamoyladenosine biosynthesis protein TsaB
MRKPARILGIETATFCGGAALLADDRLIGSRTLNSLATHSARLLRAIEDLLRETETRLDDLTGLAISIGPGSFTGVRIGLSSAKGLAVALGIPVVGVSTLEALAVRAGRDTRLICPVIDARRNETFAAAYRWERGADLPRLAIAPGVMPIRNFLRGLRGRCLFLGDGALRYRADIESQLGDRASFAPPHRILPSAEEIAWLGQRRLARGESDDLARLEPVYLRSSDARLPSPPKPRKV